MIIHLTAMHPFAEGWVMCYEENNTHFENVNLDNHCHSAIPINSLVFSSDCKDDLLLEHQDEFYAANKINKKNILPISAAIFPKLTDDEKSSAHLNLIKRVEIKPLPLTIKRISALLI